MITRTHAAAFACALAMLLSGCGESGGPFDDGRRPGERSSEQVSRLERAMREVPPERRDGVQRTLRCRRDRIRAEGGTFRIDAATVRRVDTEYRRNPASADC